MERLTFNIRVRAPSEKVWEILWGTATYTLWTAPFCEGSYAETDWEKGSKVHFLAPDKSGMVAIIKEKILHEYISFEHIGEVKKGVEDTESENVKAWAGAEENYTLKPVGNGTELVIDIDVNDEYRDFFQTTWPKALDKVKALAEETSQ